MTADEEGGAYPEKLEVESAYVTAKRPNPHGAIEADVAFTIECPECDNGHTITFHSIQKTVVCQGGCQTEWRLRI